MALMRWLHRRSIEVFLLVATVLAVAVLPLCGLEPGSAQTSNVLYMVDSGSSSLRTVDRATGRATLVGAFGGNTGGVSGLAWDDNNLFIVNTHTDRLHTVNRTTGAASFVGAYGVSNPAGLAWDGATLYMADSSTRRLYTVNRSTGSTGLVGSMGISSTIRSLAWDGSTLFATTSFALYTVNRTTGTASLVGSFGTGINGANGLTWDGANLLLITTSRLYTVNRTTGVATSVGPLGFTASGMLGLASAPPPPPECDEVHVVDLMTLEGYQRDFGASSDSCWVDPGVSGQTYALANAYRFELPESRAVAFRFVPATQFGGSDTGGYKLRLRLASLTGQVVGEVNGTGTLNLSSVQIGAELPYVLEVMRYGMGGGTQWTASMSYAYISPPTPTPLPTPTPRVLSGDFRLVPDPSGRRYQAAQSYSFHPEGGPDGIYPVTLRFANGDAAGWGSCGNAERTATRGQAVSMTACTAGKNSQLMVLRGDDLSEIPLSYNIYVEGEGVPQPALPAATGEIGATGDAVAFRYLLGEFCTGLGVQCDADLAVILLVLGGMLMTSSVVLNRNRGAATAMGVGSAIGLGLGTLILGHMVLEFPLWIVIVVILIVLSSGAFAGWRVLKSIDA